MLDKFITSVVLCVLAVPAFGIGTVPSVPANAKQIRNCEVEGYVDYTPDKWNWQGDEQPVYLATRFGNFKIMARIAFRCPEDYAEAVRLNGCLVKVTGVSASSGRERWIVVDEIVEVIR